MAPRGASAWLAAVLAASAWSAGLAGAGDPGARLVAVGSDTMEPLLRAWAADEQARTPGLEFEIEALGSSTALPALVSGRASIGAMTRDIKWAEREVFRSRYGHDPLRIRVALDAVVVFVHPQNSLTSLTVPELDAIYSHTRSCGHQGSVARWADVGTVGAWAPHAILPCGRGRRSGTRSFMRDRALCGGHFREDLREQPGPRSMVRFVAEGLCGIGYGGLGIARDGVRELSLAAREGAGPAPPSAAAIYAGSYPLSRFLNLYVNREPDRPLAPRLAGFLRYVLSDAGQERVRQAGFLPLPGEIAAQELALLGGS